MFKFSLAALAVFATVVTASAAAEAKRRVGVGEPSLRITIDLS